MSDTLRPAPDGDIEHPVVLPAQPREHARVLRGTVRRVTRPWAGLAVVVQDLAGGSLNRSAATSASRPIVGWFYRKGFYGKNLAYWLKEPWTLVTELPQNWLSSVRWFWQRGRRGYSLKDTWNLDWYLLSWLPEALEDLADGAHGYPSYPGEPEPTKWTFDTWTDHLRDLACRLRKVREEMDNVTETEQTYEEFEKVWAELGEVFFNLWD